MKILIIGDGKEAIRNATNIVISLPSDIQIAFLKNDKHDFKFARYFKELSEAVWWNPDVVIISCEDSLKLSYCDVFANVYILIDPPYSGWLQSKMFMNIPVENEIENEGYIETLRKFYNKVKDK